MKRETEYSFCASFYFGATKAGLEAKGFSVEQKMRASSRVFKRENKMATTRVYSREK